MPIKIKVTLAPRALFGLSLAIVAGWLIFSLTVVKV
jgi:hypothetical protein